MKLLLWRKFAAVASVHAA